MRRLLYIIICITTAIIFSGCGDGKRMRAMLEDVCSRNSNLKKLPTEDTLRMLTDYFDSHGTANERMMSMYVMGCMHMDKGDAPAALKWFHDAVNAADTTAADCDFLTVGRIYSQISYLFHKYKAPKIELEYSKKAEDMAWKAKDTLFAVTEVRFRSWAYQLMNDTDSVYFICKKSEKLYRQIGRDTDAACTMPSLIDIYLSRDSLPQAKQAIDIFESQSGYFDKDNEIRQGSENYYGLKGRYYFQTEQIDSAMYFYRKILCYPDVLENLKDGYSGLVDVFRRLGNADSVAKYSRLASITTDSIKKTFSPEDFVLQYSNYYADRSNEIAVNSKKNRFLFICGILIAALLLSVAGYVATKLVMRKLKKRQEEIDSERRRGKRMKKKYEQAKTDSEQAKTKIDAKTQEISELKKTIYAIQKNNTQESLDSDRIGLQQKALLAKLRKDSETGKAAAREDLLMLRYLTSMCATGFFNHISSSQYNLSDRDLVICILIRYEFKPADISVILDISSQLTSNYRAQINKKLFGKSGARTLDYNLLALNM